jgi:hypothetical protein
MDEPVVVPPASAVDSVAAKAPSVVPPASAVDTVAAKSPSVVPPAAAVDTIAAKSASATSPPSVAQLAQSGEEMSDGPAGKGSRTRLVAFVLAAVALGGLWFVMREKTQPDALIASTSQSTHESTLAAPTATANVAPVSSPESVAAAPAVPEVPSAATPKAEATDLIVVTVNTVPPDARFFHKGKPVGRSPFRVELKPGERRSFEIGRPGFFARKVVVDGKKKEMTVTMRPDH